MVQMNRISAEKSLLIRDEYDIVSACSIGEQIVDELGMGVRARYQIAVIVSELSQNMLLYAGSGVITIQRLNWNGRAGLEIMAVDSGPGIAEVETALENMDTSNDENGTGLETIKRFADEFEIDSEAGRGTTITARKWRKQEQKTSVIF